MRKKALFSALFTVAALLGPSLAHAGKGHARRMNNPEVIKKYDADGDGKLSETERATMRDEFLTKRFQMLDTNQDGAISLEEFKAGRHRRGANHDHGANRDHGANHDHGAKPDHGAKQKPEHGAKPDHGAKQK